MCGIVGAVAQRDVAEILVEGLRRLEYRGYDSAGVAVIDHKNQLTRIRRLGKVQELVDAVEESHVAGEPVLRIPAGQHMANLPKPMLTHMYPAILPLYITGLSRTMKHSEHCFRSAVISLNLRPILKSLPIWLSGNCVRANHSLKRYKKPRSILKARMARLCWTAGIHHVWWLPVPEARL